MNALDPSRLSPFAFLTTYMNERGKRRSKRRRRRRTSRADGAIQSVFFPSSEGSNETAVCLRLLCKDIHPARCGLDGCVLDNSRVCLHLHLGLGGAACSTRRTRRTGTTCSFLPSFLNRVLFSPLSCPVLSCPVLACAKEQD